jgi:hypothetical protein
MSSPEHLPRHPWHPSTVDKITACALNQCSPFSLLVPSPKFSQCYSMRRRQSEVTRTSSEDDILQRMALRLVASPTTQHLLDNGMTRWPLSSNFSTKIPDTRNGTYEPVKKGRTDDWSAAVQTSARLCPGRQELTIIGNLFSMLLTVCELKPRPRRELA